MHHPFQNLAVIPSNQPGQTSFLLAGSGSALITVNLKDGAISSRWESPLVSAGNVKEEKQEPVTFQGPPAKKRRVTHGERANIVKIYVHETGKYAIIVTGEDKCIRVFSISSEGNIDQISQRHMTKRPSALAMWGEDTILCADKFGDVYSLPLISTKEDDEAAAKRAASSVTKYTPAASQLTVHSESNRRILEEQLKLANEGGPLKTKEQMPFAHKLLLGHVSMATAILVAEVESDGQTTRYIITSDRDEHIRVSRGPPQAYVIENYCLGHKEYVSSLCMATPQYLVSAGGDDFVFVWDWLKGALLGKINLRPVVSKFITESTSNDDQFRIAVSGLWSFGLDDKSQLLIACEGIPALFYCDVVDILNPQCQIHSISLDGNLLDVASFNEYVILSIDNIHKPCTKEIDSSSAFKSRLVAVKLDKSDGGSEEHLNRLLVDANELMTAEWHEDTLKGLLYNVENLRNRRHGADGDEDE